MLVRTFCTKVAYLPHCTPTKCESRKCKTSMWHIASTALLRHYYIGIYANAFNAVVYFDILQSAEIH